MQLKDIIVVAAGADTAALDLAQRLAGDHDAHLAS